MNGELDFAVNYLSSKTPGCISVFGVFWDGCAVSVVKVPTFTSDGAQCRTNVAQVLKGGFKLVGRVEVAPDSGGGTDFVYFVLPEYPEGSSVEGLVSATAAQLRDESEEYSRNHQAMTRTKEN